MDLDKNIEHGFDLKGLEVNDTFLGCNKCWFRLNPGTATKLKCHNCDNQRMNLFTVTKHDKLPYK